MTTAIFRNDLFLEHDPGFNHVESPDRLRAIYQRLDQEPPANTITPVSWPAADYHQLTRNHSTRLFDQIAATAGQTFNALDPDTATSPQSFEAACLAAGAVIEGCRMVIAGETDNGFALVRPPGHHAEEDRAMGFCLFNNVAVAARYALNELKLQRVLIVDWDLHHGNGSQHSFYDSNRVLYFSSHQYPYYPGSGGAGETGSGKGEGYTVNVPLSGGQGDHAFARIFNELLIPLTRQYQPELILVSAGFDTYYADPLGGMNVTEKGFAFMTRALMDIAAEVCQGRVVMSLEGGYDLTGLADGAMAVINELSGASILNQDDLDAFTTNNNPLPALEEAQRIAKNHWTL